VEPLVHGGRFRVNKDLNTIWFTTDHFSLYTVQATAAKDLSLRIQGCGIFAIEDLRGPRIPPGIAAGRIGLHERDGAGDPGPAGFDLTLRRKWDLTTAKSDSRMNGITIVPKSMAPEVYQEILHEISNDTVTTDIFEISYQQLNGSSLYTLKDLTPDQMTSLSNLLKSLTFNLSHSCLLNMGDYAYSMGKGWRLDLPYIRNSNRELQLVLPGGSIQSIYSLQVISGNACDLVLEGHDGMDFRLELKRIGTNEKHYPIGGGEIININYKLDSAVLTMKDGTAYSFDCQGRLTSIKDPAGINEIRIVYDDFSYTVNTPEGTKTFYVYQPRISYIEDALHRQIGFATRRREIFRIFH